MVVLNSQLKKGVDLHDTLHGFRKGVGLGTVALEANLAHQLARLTHEALFQVLLDFRKAHK